MEEFANISYIKGKTLENNVEFLFKTAGVCCKIKIQKVASKKSRMLQLEIP